MASSNRHWPSMFKSKPTCNTHHHHQWQTHDSNNLLSSTCHKSPYTSGCEERSPEPKPRWNPKPEQIRILESIFNSGMVNPPRDEIRKIRAQLQEYGQVGDANVFYWFQNRKSRSKHKNRHLQKSQNRQSSPVSAATTKVATTSSSSSSEKSSAKSIEFLLNSPTASVNQQAYFGGGGTGYHHQHHSEFTQEPFFFTTVMQPPPPPPPATATTSLAQGFCFSELGNVINQDNSHGNLDQTGGSCSGVLLTDLMMMNHQNAIPKNNNCKSVDEGKMKMSSYNFIPPPPAASVATPANPTTVPSVVNDIQGVEEPGPAGKSTVFINDVAFEVAVGPFNVREAFGDDAMLIHSYGQPVVTNEWGVTLQSLQHGAFYYLVRSLTYDHSSTIDLI